MSKSYKYITALSGREKRRRNMNKNSGYEIELFLGQIPNGLVQINNSFKKMFSHKNGEADSKLDELIEIAHPIIDSFAKYWRTAGGQSKQALQKKINEYVSEMKSANVFLPDNGKMLTGLIDKAISLFHELDKFDDEQIASLQGTASNNTTIRISSREI